MTLFQEFRLWIRGKYPTDRQELENLMLALDVPQTELHSEFSTDTAKAHDRIRAYLHDRWVTKVGLVIAVLGLITTWLVLL